MENHTGDRHHLKTIVGLRSPPLHADLVLGGGLVTLLPCTLQESVHHGHHGCQQDLLAGDGGSGWRDAALQRRECGAYPEGMYLLSSLWDKAEGDVLESPRNSGIIELS